MAFVRSPLKTGSGPTPPTGYIRLIDHAPIVRNGDYLTIVMPDNYSDYDYIYITCISDNYQKRYIDDLLNTHVTYEENIDIPTIDRTYKLRTDTITHAGISVQVPFVENSFNYDNDKFTLTITDESITATAHTGTLTDTNLVIIGIHHYDYWLDAFETSSRIDTGIQLSTQEAFAKDWEIEFETDHIGGKRARFLVAGSVDWGIFGFDLIANDSLLLRYTWSNGQTYLPISYSEVESTPTTWRFKKVGQTMYLYVNGTRVWSFAIINISKYNDAPLILAYDMGSTTISFGYFGFRWIENS